MRNPVAISQPIPALRSLLTPIVCKAGEGAWWPPPLSAITFVCRLGCLLVYADYLVAAPAGGATSAAAVASAA